MNKAKTWYIIPSAILPYLLLCTFAVIFTSTENPVSESVMGMFGDNILILGAVVLIYCIAATVLSVIHLILSIVKKSSKYFFILCSLSVKIYCCGHYIIFVR